MHIGIGTSVGNSLSDRPPTLVLSNFTISLIYSSETPRVDPHGATSPPVNKQASSDSPVVIHVEAHVAPSDICVLDVSLIPLRATGEF